MGGGVVLHHCITALKRDLHCAYHTPQQGGQASAGRCRCLRSCHCRRPCRRAPTRGIDREESPKALTCKESGGARLNRRTPRMRVMRPARPVREPRRCGGLSSGGASSTVRIPLPLGDISVHWEPILVDVASLSAAPPHRLPRRSAATRHSKTLVGHGSPRDLGVAGAGAAGKHPCPRRPRPLPPARPNRVFAAPCSVCRQVLNHAVHPDSCSGHKTFSAERSKRC